MTSPEQLDPYGKLREASASLMVTCYNTLQMLDPAGATRLLESLISADALRTIRQRTAVHQRSCSRCHVSSEFEPLRLRDSGEIVCCDAIGCDRRRDAGQPPLSRLPREQPKAGAR